jgi:low temperature requirement protein LtrA
MPFRTPMVARDVDEEHRASTPLELFFDLAFVVAISQAASGLHHGLVDGNAVDTIGSFLLVFFAIWWAWMNFTWFASAYDPDDGPYRLAVFVVMAGVLIVAAGIPRAFHGTDLGVITFGYVVMRLAMVALWLRAAYAVEDGRKSALRYAVGIALVQVFWVVRLLLPVDLTIQSFLVLAAAELAVPLWAEAAGRTSWHPGHIAERYGLFTIIVLGESVLSATVGVQTALDADNLLGDIAPVVVGGLLIVFSLWWLYFDMPVEDLVAHVREAFVEHLSGAFLWGYGHYIVWASIAATGAGIVVGIDQATGHSDLSDLAAGFAITVPVSLYLLLVWALHAPAKPPGPMKTYVVPIGVVLILLGSVTPQPVLTTGIVLAAMVVAGVIAHGRETVETPREA